MLILLPILLPLLGPLTTASPSSLLPRKPVDVYMICEDPPPLASLPDGYDPQDYPTTLSLCSALNGAPRNLGCVCHASTGRIDCRPPPTADTTLYNSYVDNSRFTFGAQGFSEFCANACYCSTADAAALARSSEPPSTATSTTTTSARHGRPTNRVSGVINVGFFDPVRDPNPFRDVTLPFNISVDATGGAGRNWWANQCKSGSGCNSSVDCGNAQDGGGCMCAAAQKSSYQPGIGAAAFVAACIVSMAGSSGAGGSGSGNGIGGKRGLDPGTELACPCNGTYVSRKCCEVRDGLVWEAEEFKLGELVWEDEL